MRLRRAGRQRHRPAIARNRLVVAAERVERVAEIGMGGQQVAPEPRRFAIGHDRLLAAFEPHQRVAEIVLRFGEVRLARDGGGILRRRLGDIAELHRDLAGKRHHIGAAALEGEQAAARVERLAAPAGTIERRDLLEQRRYRHVLLDLARHRPTGATPPGADLRQVESSLTSRAARRTGPCRAG